MYVSSIILYEKKDKGYLRHSQYLPQVEFSLRARVEVNASKTNGENLLSKR